jgi:hypothetical protein
MSGEIYRPSVREMFFCLYTRPLHPELFETLATREVRRDDYVLTLHVTPVGHVMTWQTGNFLLTELTAVAGMRLPRRGRVVRRRFQGERTGSFRPAHGVTYQMSSQMEVLPPEIFVYVHDEIVADSAKRGLLYHHVPRHRLGLAPLSFVTVEGCQGTLAISTSHTFPDEYAVVRTQSLIERTNS